MMNLLIFVLVLLFSTGIYASENQSPGSVELTGEHESLLLQIRDELITRRQELVNPEYTITKKDQILLRAVTRYIPSYDIFISMAIQRVLNSPEFAENKLRQYGLYKNELYCDGDFSETRRFQQKFNEVYFGEFGLKSFAEDFLYEDGDKYFAYYKALTARLEFFYRNEYYKDTHIDTFLNSPYETSIRCFWDKLPEQEKIFREISIIKKSPPYGVVDDKEVNTQNRAE